MINRRLWPIVIFLFLIASWAHAGNITVNSLEDTNERDDTITLREAIMLSEGGLVSWILTAAEQVQVSTPVGSGIPDTINFGVSGTIMPNSGLPSITDDGTVIDASSQWSGVWPEGQPGVILDGANSEDMRGLGITGAANCHIRGLFITKFSNGILIHYGARFNTVGGPDIGSRNVISGNQEWGVHICDPGTDNNIVSGNFIGTDVTGTVALGNLLDGFLISDPTQYNIIGGRTAEERNIISGNGRNGGTLGGGAANSIVSGNYVGTDVTGTVALGNGWLGIMIFDGAHSNTIGGTTAGERNVISGNGDGVYISGPGTGSNVVIGNFIGTDVTGAVALGNLWAGVRIKEGAQSNIIGGTGSGEGNTIAFSVAGIAVQETNTRFNRISGNSIHDNAWPGIDLSEGGNDEIQPPVLIWADLMEDILTISGDGAGANATVEVFKADASTLQSPAHAGQTFLGSLTADGNGRFSGSLSVAGQGISVNDALVVTTTHTNGNTSEFSPTLIWTGFPVSPPVVANIDGRKLIVGEGGILYYDGRPFRAIGVNYGGAFEGVLWDPNDTTYKWGFAQLAAHGGIPFARIQTATPWPIHLAMYENDRETYLRLLDGVIQAAEEYGIGLILQFFTFAHTVPDLVGEPMNQWGNPSSKTLAFMRRYTQDIVSRYRDSPAIWAWEFGSEFSLLADLHGDWRPPIETELGTPPTRGPEDDLTTDMIVIAFKEFAEGVRSVDPTRPITTGNSISRPPAENLRQGNSWSDLDTREEFKANLSRVTPSPCDMVSIHLYPEEMLYERFAPGYYSSYSELIALTMEASTEEGKALFVGEFGAGDYKDGNPEVVAQIIQEMLDALVEYDVPLAAIYSYDIASGDGYDITLTNSRSYLLDAIRDANEAISYKLAGEQLINYPWDVNGDGKVDVSDLVFVAKYFGRNVTAPLYLNPDVNGDGEVDILDIILVAQHFGEVYSPAAPARNIWNVDQEHLPLLTRIYNIMENNPSSDPDFLAAKSLLQRLTSGTKVSKTEAFQNYPNPFNPEMDYPPTSRAYLGIQIVPILGEEYMMPRFVYIEML